jgi:hypothetical protein
MSSYKATTSIVVLFVALIAVFSGLATRGDSQNTTRPSKPLAFKGRELPIVDFDELEPNDPVARELLSKRAKHYDKSSSQPIQDVPSISGRIWSNHWSKKLPALPTDASDIVLIGSITRATAHLSNDKTAVFSEFEVAIQEILKAETKGSSYGSSLLVERFGGAVRFHSGRVQRYETAGQGMPVVGRTYLLFLKRINTGPNYSILTGYDVSGPAVEPLDGALADEGGEEYAFDKYAGIDLSQFLTDVRAVISKAVSGN